MSFKVQKRASTGNTSQSIHAPRKSSIAGVSHGNMSRNQGGGSGLSSLQSTLRKLRGDEERHQILMDDMARRLRLPSRMQDHFSKSFVESGLVFVKTIGQGSFGLVKMAKRKVVQEVEAVRSSMSFPQTPKKGQALPDDERAQSSAARFVAVRVIPRLRAREAHLKSKELFTKMESYATLKRQVDALRALDHPNIVRIHETFEDFQNIYIVMQLCTGGSLLVAREMGNGKTLSECRTSEILEQILAGIAFTHERGIVHQDLRLENIHYESADVDSRIVITDWGAVEYIATPPDKARKKLPSTDFSAPELVPQWRTDRSDVWSIGIMMHCLLTQALPVWPQWPPTADFSWSQDPDGYEISFSAPCCQVLVSMLRLEYKQRPSARELLTDPWIVGGRTHAFSEEAKVLPLSMGSSIMKYRRANRMQKATAWFAATHLSGEQLHALTEAFNAIDTDRSGTIDKDEMERALRKCFQQAKRDMETKGCDESEELVEDLDEILKNEKHFHGMMAAMDADGSGVISYSNFITAAMDEFLQDSIQLLWHAFQRFDHTGSGRVSGVELSALLKTREVDEVLQRLSGYGSSSTAGFGSAPLVRSIKKTKTVAELEDIFHAMGSVPQDPAQLIAEADANGNGTINFEEFVAVITDRKIDLVSSGSKPSHGETDALDELILDSPPSRGRTA